MQYTLIATSAIGIEALLANELGGKWWISGLRIIS